MYEQYERASDDNEPYHVCLFLRVHVCLVFRRKSCFPAITHAPSDDHIAIYKINTVHTYHKIGCMCVFLRECLFCQLFFFLSHTPIKYPVHEKGSFCILPRALLSLSSALIGHDLGKAAREINVTVVAVISFSPDVFTCTPVSIVRRLNNKKTK